MTEGTVVALNPKRRFVGVRTNAGICVVQVLGSHRPAIDDVITGDLDQFGSVILDNRSQNQHFGADIYDHNCDQRRMRLLMGL